MTGLTEKQAAIYEFLRTEPVLPSMRDVMRHFGIKGTNGVKCHFDALEKKGYIRRGPKNSKRTLWVKGRAVVDLDAIETGTEIEIGGRTFVLTLKDESDAGTKP
eukprot:GHVR01104441.1.p4 GENE.GHVR01104441.1~~GHVR01104441.1.p4  ORF type:complete len:104 (-),score=17.31 GHVR01104441.1:244-555(-)